MAKKRPFYKKFRKTLYETVSDSGESILRYRGHDDKEHYVASSEEPGGDTPTPMPSGGGITEVTWQELKDKRDNGQLIAGSLYRITDYQCTTTQENTRSAGHQFDIVLLALSEDKLAEEGWAMPHDGDEYFQNSKLEAWKVWYCLDNDKSRFAWADDSVDEGSKKESIKVYISAGDIAPIGEYIVPAAKYQEGIPESIEIGGKTYYIWINNDEVVGAATLSRTPKEGDKIYYTNGNEIGYVISYQPENLIYNGRGVIYRLIDEWNNDVPWDYKNIMFTINDETTYSLSFADHEPDYEFDATLNGGTLGVIVNTTYGESKQGKTPKSVYPISRVMLQQCLIYLNEDVSLNSYLFTNDGHANIIYGLEIYDPNA